MRARTSVLVGMGSAAVVGLSWISGLQPRQPLVTGGAKVEQSAVVDPSTPSPLASSTPAGSIGRRSTPSSAQGRSSSTPHHTSAPTPTAPKVVSGTVRGAVINTKYGPVQVKVTYVGTRMTDIRALQLTDSSATSVQISAGAAPILRREVLAKQSAQVDMVSGASFTSSAYLQSLQSAIDAAHLG